MSTKQLAGIVGVALVVCFGPGIARAQFNTSSDGNYGEESGGNVYTSYPYVDSPVNYSNGVSGTGYAGEEQASASNTGDAYTQEFTGSVTNDIVFTSPATLIPPKPLALSARTFTLSSSTTIRITGNLISSDLSAADPLLLDLSANSGFDIFLGTDLDFDQLVAGDNNLFQLNDTLDESVTLDPGTYTFLAFAQVLSNTPGPNDPVSATSAGHDYQTSEFDLTVSLPEPTSLSFCTIATVGLLSRRRRA